MTVVEMIVAMRACVMPDPSPVGRRCGDMVVTAETPAGPGMIIVRSGPTAEALKAAVRECFARWSKANGGAS